MDEYSSSEAKSIHALCQMQCDPKKFKKETDVLEILRKIAADRGFVINGNSASGYSMFYVLSEQLQRVKGTQIAHGELRKTLVEFLRNSPKLPDGTDLFKFVYDYDSWADYLRSMERDGTWGDHLTLRAAANVYKTPIRVISSLDCEASIIPDHLTVDNTNPLVLGHVHEKNYVILKPRQELSAACAKCREVENQLKQAAVTVESKELEHQLQEAGQAAEATCKEVENQLRKERLAAEAAQSNCEELIRQLRKAAEVLESKGKEVENQLRKAAEALESKGKELEHQFQKAAEDANATSNELEYQLKIDKLSLELQNKVVTVQEILKMKHDVGTCWLDLGIALKIDPEARVRNLENDCNNSSDRAHQVLQIWIDLKGNDATVGCLARALVTIGQRRIAEKLLDQILEVRDAWTEERQPRATPENRNQTCMRCHDLEKKLHTLRTKMESEQNKINHLELERENLESEKNELKEVNARLIIFDSPGVRSAPRDEDSSRAIKKLKDENEMLKRKRKTLEEEMLKYRNPVCRVFLPNGKDFSNSPGIVSTLKRETAAALVAERSSHGLGEASDIFDHKKGKTSGTKEEKDSWWSIDLGDNYLLVITHYALRHGKSDGKSVLQQWQLQGSVDGITWKNLETDHKREYPSEPLQFKDPFPYYTGTWPVKGEVRAFRFFRILQTSKNSSGRYGIYLSGVELYGVLSKFKTGSH